MNFKIILCNTQSLQIGTVCGKDFTNVTATKICQNMGYKELNSWEKGLQWNFQESLPVFLDSVQCTDNAPDLAGCTFIPKSNDSGCVHEHDIFLRCDIGEGEVFNFHVSTLTKLPNNFIKLVLLIH